MPFPEAISHGLCEFPNYNSGGYEDFSVAVADVNGDGKPDLVVANYCASSSNCSNGTVSVLLGNGDGTFQAPVSYNSGGEEAYSVAVADVNGDGKPDLLVANECVSNGNCTNGGAAIRVRLSCDLVRKTMMPKCDFGG